VKSDNETRIPLRALYQEIREVYLASGRDWIVAYSGGKDSTATLQLIWYALTALPPEQRRHHVYIVSNDTLVEDPAMAVRTHLSCQRINAAAQAEAEACARAHPDYPKPVTPLFSAHITKPELRQRFFYLLIGLGYPSPTVRTRWCVARLKLEPARTFIEQHISNKGEVVVTLGAREEESTTRARSLRKHALPGQLLKRHSTITGAWVYTPIEVWSTDDVWIYLHQVNNPWGEENRHLAALYQASSGECPLVVDTKTPSCAGSRFGCWTCTVTKENRSMESRVDAGEEWLVPLLQFRNGLTETTDPEKKHLYRSLEARGTHLIQLNRQGQPSYRCYTLEFRKDLLRQLLQVQQQVREEGPDPTMELIDFEELCAIRQVWRQEGDWEDSLPRIYREVVGRDEAWPTNEDEQWMNAKTKEALLYHCQRLNLPTQLVIELLQACHVFQRSVHAPVTIETKEHTQEGELVPLFADDPATQAGQQAMQHLVERIADLFNRRDWRTHQERLAEVLGQYEAEQEKRHSEPRPLSWI
jgi:DNA sulfur modification protein DndC